MSFRVDILYTCNYPSIIATILLMTRACNILFNNNIPSFLTILVACSFQIEISFNLLIVFSSKFTAF